MSVMMRKGSGVGDTLLDSVARTSESRTGEEGIGKKYAEDLFNLSLSYKIVIKPRNQI